MLGDFLSHGIRMLKRGAPDDIFVSGRIHIYPSVGSTMDIAADFIERGYGDGTSVLALTQTAGRGSVDPKTQQARQWWSKAGNLLLSRIVSARGNAIEIEFVAALAVAELIAPLLPRATVSLKFPNDVLVDGAKICGCLVPAQYQATSKDHATQLINLGVGVNLAHSPPPQSRDNGPLAFATSLKDHGIAIGIDEFFPLFEHKFEELCDIRDACGFTTILKRIGFADEATGEIVLTSTDGATVARGTYCGASAERQGDDFYMNYLWLRQADGAKLRIPHHGYTARAVISAPHVLSGAVREQSADTYNAG